MKLTRPSGRLFCQRLNSAYTCSGQQPKGSQGAYRQNTPHDFRCRNFAYGLDRLDLSYMETYSLLLPCYGGGQWRLVGNLDSHF